LKELDVRYNQLKKLPAEIAYHPNFDEFKGLYGLLPLHIRVEKATKRFLRNNYLKVLASTVCLCFCLFLWTRSSSNRF